MIEFNEGIKTKLLQGVETDGSVRIFLMEGEAPSKAQWTEVTKTNNSVNTFWNSNNTPFKENRLAVLSYSKAQAISIRGLEFGNIGKYLWEARKAYTYDHLKKGVASWCIMLLDVDNTDNSDNDQSQLLIIGSVGVTDSGSNLELSSTLIEADTRPYVGDVKVKLEV